MVLCHLCNSLLHQQVTSGNTWYMDRYERVAGISIHRTSMDKSKCSNSIKFRNILLATAQTWKGVHKELLQGFKLCLQKLLTWPCCPVMFHKTKVLILANPQSGSWIGCRNTDFWWFLAFDSLGHLEPCVWHVQWFLRIGTIFTRVTRPREDSRTLSRSHCCLLLSTLQPKTASLQLTVHWSMMINAMSLTKLAFEEAQMNGRSFSDYVARSHQRQGKCSLIEAEKVRKFT